MSSMRVLRLIVGGVMLLCSLLMGACGEITLNHISDSDLERYLEKKYDCEFTLQSKEVTPLTEEDEGDLAQSRTLYTYTDENGITCHIYQTFRYNEAGTRFYDYTEDYQVMYVRSHPEILDELYAGGFSVECETEPTNTKYASSTYWVTLDSSNDVEEVVTLIMDVFEKMRPISDTGYELANGDSVNSERPIVRLKHYAYQQNITTRVFYYFPTEQTPFDRSQVSQAITEAQEIMSDYAAERYASLGPGWEEQLKNSKRSVIDNVLYQGETVIRELEYSDEYECYVVDTREHMEQSCDFFISDISELATTAGFTEEIETDCIRYIKEKRIVEFTRDNASVNCTINGELYRYQGYYIWEEGEYMYRNNMPKAILTEQDLEEMFGITFDIDQILNRATMLVQEVA